MRKLLYVPVIHTEADLGTMAAAIEAVTASASGQRRWDRHRETALKFWKSVKDYLMSRQDAALKIYQDGLAADGDLGRKIVEEAARRGSKNHQIIISLLERGAELRKTEDASLLIQEYESLSRLVSGKPQRDAPTSAGSREERDRLLEERDRFISRTINETLKNGETSVLFIGAFHDVLSALATDIEVRQVKEVEKVRAYFSALSSGGDEAILEQLAHYLAAPICAMVP